MVRRMLDPRFEQLFRRGEALRTAGRIEEAHECFAEAAGLVEPEAAPVAFALAHGRAAALAYGLGRVEERWKTVARCGAVEAESRAKAAGDNAVLEMEHGELETARSAVAEALELAGAAGWAAGEARQHGNLGLLELRQGHPAEARRHLVAAAEAFGLAGDALGQAQAWSALGEVAMSAGDAESAMVHFEEAFGAMVSAGLVRQAAVPRANMGHLLRRAGRVHEARIVYGEVIDALGPGGDAEAGARLDLATVCLDLGHGVEAARELDLAEAAAQRPGMCGRVLYARADLLACEGELSRALGVTGEALSRFHEISDLRGVVAASVLKARLQWMLGREPDRLPEEAFSRDLPDLMVAADAVTAERLLASGELEAAVEHAQPPDDAGDGDGDRVRALRTEAFLALLSFLRGSVEPVEAASVTRRTVAELASGGAVRDAAGTALANARFFCLAGSPELAGGLLEQLDDLEEQGWPAGWRRSSEVLRRLYALTCGEAPCPPSLPASEDLEARAFDELVSAVARGDGGGFGAATRTLRGLGRTLLADLCESMYRRLRDAAAS